MTSPIRFTLRAKGMAALGVLVVYTVLTAWFLAHERARLLSHVEQMEAYSSAQMSLQPVVDRLAEAVQQTRQVVSSPHYTPGPSPRYAAMIGSLHPLLLRLAGVGEADVALKASIQRVAEAAGRLHSEPSGLNVIALLEAEERASERLGAVIGALDRHQRALGKAYRDTQQVITFAAVVTSIVGALATATVIVVFFTRLARDLERLQARAGAIVAGYDGPPLGNDRRDEVGSLIDAVNRMQLDLRRSESRQEVSRQQRFHQEKMAAVGSMAVAIGHEVSNPMAAIAGIAQFLIDETRGKLDDTSRLAHDFGGQILRQTERVSQIMRQLSTLTRPHSATPELVGLNSLVQSTVSFIAYDKRLRGVEFELDLDSSLPAVTVVADHVTQVLINLFLNAADAMDGGPADHVPRIRVATRSAAGAVRLEVADNGHGMTPEVLARAFEESFTTKPAGRGRGIGLFLCKTLVEQAGGRIELASQPGAGTTVTLHLPLDPAAPGGD